VSSLELFSMAVVLGLIAGSIFVGFGMFRRAVTCSVVASEPGLVLMTDGRDSGMRTGPNGKSQLRLVPGRHSVRLAGRPDAPPVARPLEAVDAALADQSVEVRAGEACVIRFEARAAEGSAESAQ
jgi:hypothetical protein